MPKVKRPRIKNAAEDREDQDQAPASVRPAGPDAARLREKAATYAFGTVVSGAAMVALAAWMGGSLGVFGQRFNNGVTVIMRSAGLSVEKVQVFPALDPVVEAKVLEAAGISTGDNMFAADPHVIRRRIEQLDAIGSVSVYRLWPDQVTITADPREPVALWENDGEWRVIDQRGRSFAQSAPGDFLHLPRVTGKDAGLAAAGFLATIADYPDLASRVESASRISARRWDVTFRGGVVVALPEDAAMQDALAAVNLMHAHNSLLDLPAARVDARHPDRLAIRPLPGAPEIVDGGA
jgi:cell division protein FtsQ